MGSKFCANCFWPLTPIATADVVVKGWLNFFTWRGLCDRSLCKSSPRFLNVPEQAFVIYKFSLVAFLQVKMIGLEFEREGERVLRCA